MYASMRGVNVGIPPFIYWNSNCRSNEYSGQCQVGSLTGAVASESVTEAPKGSLSAVRNRA